MPQKHYSCRGYFSQSVPEPRSQHSLPGWCCLHGCRDDPCWQGGDSDPNPNPNPSHALASLQWLL